MTNKNKMVKVEDILDLIKIILGEDYDENEDIQDLNFDDAFDNKKYEDIDEALNSIEEKIQIQIDKTDIIDYQPAIKYLAENDYSLKQSLKVAANLWYKYDQLDSKKLATFLKRQYMQEQWEKLKSEIKYNFSDD